MNFKEILLLKAAGLFVRKTDYKHPSFFIISSGRSGTTLLRKLLVNSGKIYIPPESNDWIPNIAIVFTKYCYRNWQFKLKKSLEILKNDPDFEYWNIDLKELELKLENQEPGRKNFYGFIEELYTFNQDKSLIIGDKTPYLVLEISWLKTIFPNAKYIHLLRDGRDVVSSRMNRFNETIEQATNRWVWSIQETEKHFDSTSKDFIEIKYEDLVSDPEKAMNQICSFLNIEYSDQMLEHQEINLGDTHLKHHEESSNPINARAIEKWKQDLSEDEIAYITSKTEKWLREKGYN